MQQLKVYQCSTALSVYTVLMRTNSPKQPGCLQYQCSTFGQARFYSRRERRRSEKKGIVSWSYERKRSFIVCFLLWNFVSDRKTWSFFAKCCECEVTIWSADTSVQETGLFCSSTVASFFFSQILFQMSNAPTWVWMTQTGWIALRTVRNRDKKKNSFLLIENTEIISGRLIDRHRMPRPV